MNRSHLLPLVLLPGVLLVARCSSSAPPPSSGASSGSGGSVSSGASGSSGSASLAGRGGDSGGAGDAGQAQAGTPGDGGQGGEGEPGGSGGAGEGGEGGAGQGGTEQGGAGQGGSESGGKAGEGACEEGKVPCDDLCIPAGQACNHATIEFAPSLVGPPELFVDIKHYGHRFVLDLDQDGKDELFFVWPGSMVIMTRRIRFNGESLEKVEDLEEWVIGQGDFDGQNGPDLISVLGSELRVLRNKGGGVLEPAWKSSFPSDFPLAPNAYFVNLAQGKPGVLLFRGNNPYFIQVVVMEPQGTLSFGKELQVPSYEPARILDVNQDGISDLLFVSKDGIETWLGTGTSFVPEKTVPLPHSFLLHLNKDSFLDVFRIVKGSTENKAEIYLGNLSMDFLKYQEISFPSYETTAHVMTGDFDGDGRTDVHLRTSHNFQIWRGNGKGGITMVPFKEPMFASHLGDVNGDGLSDLVSLYDGSLAVRINITKKVP